ncbi:MAG: hypothetical protein ABFS32_10300 [Bacteroidota bacterium]
MKNLIITIALVTLTLSLQAQIDEARMDKDLRVASKVLETLTQGDTRLIMYNDNVEGNYIEGYGVMFSVGGGYSVFVPPVRPVIYLQKDKGDTYTIAPVPGISEKEAEQIAKEAEQMAEKAEQMAKEAEQMAKEAAVMASVDNLDLEKIMIEFLVDYSQMIGQLKPNDKIVISTKKSDYLYAMWDDGDNKVAGSNGITAEMLKMDHNDYMAGKLNRDQLISKIKVNKENGEAERSKDLDLFGSMIKTVYDQSYTDSYFVTWKPDYQKIKGVGAIYAFKVYSSYDENGLYRMPAINEKGLTGSERNKHVEELYPIFVKGMKENIIQYGRTINSLGSDELMILKITLTKCDNCNIPKRVQFSIKQSVLTEFNAGKISQKDAVAKVNLTEIND